MWKKHFAEAILKHSYLVTALVLFLSIGAASCSSPIVKESLPEEKLVEAKRNIEKRRYENAYESLEELRYVTTGTRLGGEVQFLLGETAFKRGKYPDAESHYANYLTTYPGGPFSEKAIYQQAMSKVKQLQKRRIGFLSFKSYIPHDRNISLLREARVLFEIYIESYPSGKWLDTSTSYSEELLTKEGMHELEIATFYLKKKSPQAALARVKRVLEGDFPDDIKTQARGLMQKAEASLASAEDKLND